MIILSNSLLLKLFYSWWNTVKHLIWSLLGLADLDRLNSVRRQSFRFSCSSAVRLVLSHGSCSSREHDDCFALQYVSAGSGTKQVPTITELIYSSHNPE